MKPGKAFIIVAALAQFACIATAQKPPARVERITEVPFRLVSAKVETFPRALPRRNEEPYREALVVQISVDRKLADSLPPSIEPYLYFGTRRLRPFDTLRDDEREDLLLTFHLPEWREIREPVPMVLTILHGDPVLNPEKYRNYPRFDPRSIGD